MSAAQQAFCLSLNGLNFNADYVLKNMNISTFRVFPGIQLVWT